MKPGWRELIFIVMLGLVPLGAWAYINVPRDDAKRKMDANRAERIRMINTANAAKDAARESIENSNHELTRSLGAAEKRLRPDFDIGQARSEVRKLAAENNLYPEYHDQGGPHALPGTTSFEAYTFTLSNIRGNYGDFRKFLRELGGLGYRIWIPMATVRRAQNQKRQGEDTLTKDVDQIEAELKLKILIPTTPKDSKGQGNERGKQQSVTSPVANEHGAVGPRTDIK